MRGRSSPTSFEYQLEGVIASLREVLDLPPAEPDPEPDGWLTLRRELAGMPVVATLTYGPGGMLGSGRWETRCKLAWRHTRAGAVSVKIRSRVPTDDLKIETGLLRPWRSPDRRFDSRIIVAGSLDSDELAAFLPPHVRSAIERFWDRDLTIHVERGQVTADIGDLVLAPHEVRTLFNLMFSLVYPAPAPGEPSEKTCLCCGQRLVRDVVSCPACGASAHASCRGFLGGCPTPACRASGPSRVEDRLPERLREPERPFRIGPAVSTVLDALPGLHPRLRLGAPTIDANAPRGTLTASSHEGPGAHAAQIVYWIHVEDEGGFQAMTRVQLRTPGKATPRLRMFPQSAIHAIAKFFGMDDMDLGDPQLDPRFIIQSELPVARVQGLLAPRVRETLLSLRGLGACLETGPQGIELTVAQMVLRSPELDGMLRTVFELAERLHPELFRPIDDTVAAPSGPAPVPANAEAGCCRVCGERLSRDIVLCGSCQTPHHRECWDYNGWCSLYGCGGTFATRSSSS